MGFQPCAAVGKLRHSQGDPGPNLPTHLWLHPAPGLLAGCQVGGWVERAGLRRWPRVRVQGVASLGAAGLDQVEENTCVQC